MLKCFASLWLHLIFLLSYFCILAVHCCAVRTAHNQVSFGTENSGAELSCLLAGPSMCIRRTHLTLGPTARVGKILSVQGKALQSEIKCREIDAHLWNEAEDIKTMTYIVRVCKGNRRFRTS